MGLPGTGLTAETCKMKQKLSQEAGKGSKRTLESNMAAKRWKTNYE